MRRVVIVDWSPGDDLADRLRAALAGRLADVASVTAGTSTDGDVAVLVAGPPWAVAVERLVTTILGGPHRDVVVVLPGDGPPPDLRARLEEHPEAARLHVVAVREATWEGDLDALAALLAGAHAAPSVAQPPAIEAAEPPAEPPAIEPAEAPAIEPGAPPAPSRADGGSPLDRLLRAEAAGGVPRRRERRVDPVAPGAAPPAPPAPAAPRWRGWRRRREPRADGIDPGPRPPADEVDVTIFSPPRAAPSEQFLVQAFLHLPADAAAAAHLATQFDDEATARGFAGLSLPIARGTTVSVELRAPSLVVDEVAQEVVWRGRPASVQFAVTVPPGTPPGSVIATVLVSQASVPVGHVKFKVTVGETAAAAPVPVGDDARPYSSAFVSYAHEDRGEVLRRVQVLRLSHIRCFQDLLELDPGERWAARLYEEIDRCDVLLLFWSRHARDSEWVRREVRYALARRRTDLDPPEILPVVIEVPPCPPWPELADRQFDDPIARLIAGS